MLLKEQLTHLFRPQELFLQAQTFIVIKMFPHLGRGYQQKMLLLVWGQYVKHKIQADGQRKKCRDGEIPNFFSPIAGNLRKFWEGQIKGPKTKHFLLTLNNKYFLNSPWTHRTIEGTAKELQTRLIQLVVGRITGAVFYQTVCVSTTCNSM